MRSLYDHGSSTISETLNIVDNGLRRLGITGNGLPANLAKLANLVARTVDRPPNTVLSVASIDRMVELRARGCSQYEIAQALGITQSAVSKRLRQHGIRNNKFAPRAPRKAAA
jgi:DNA-binding transcriptional LysR family regulator